MLSWMSLSVYSLLETVVVFGGVARVCLSFFRATLRNVAESKMAAGKVSNVIFCNRNITFYINMT